MADISKITLPNGSSYDFKDSVARSGLAGKAASSHTHSEYALKAKYGDTTIDVGRKSGTTVGRYSTAEGVSTTASGYSSHAEGTSTTASGVYSHAEGLNTTASGSHSHAEGGNTTASGSHSHAEGTGTTTSGDYSHAEGSVTIASGLSSHAEGTGTTASGDYSHAGGLSTQAQNTCEVAYGRYNISSSDTLFSVGDGTADDARHNAFEITTTGGKLHDKDIAVKDDIPTSLPASGGNADTVGDLPADTFMRYEVTIQLLTSINDMLTAGTYGVFPSTPDFPTEYGTWGFLEVRRFGSICYQTIIFDTGKVITRAITIVEGYNTWTEWHDPYTNIDKPYVTGSATVAANSATCTSNHGFTPSAVIWWDGNYSGVATSFSGTQFTIDKTSSVGRTINYLIFK